MGDAAYYAMCDDISHLELEEEEEEIKMTDFIYVPRGSDTQAVGGFLHDEVAGYKYTPVGNKLTIGSDPSEESRLVVVLKPTDEKREVFYFFGKVADNLLSQIEDRILRSKETSLND